MVLRKPGKPYYTITKAYRPIALENTLGKVLESVMMDIISYLTETYELLPAHHYRGWPGRSAEDAMMILTENIYKAWKNKKIYTAAEWARRTEPRRTEPNRTEHWANRTEVRFVSWRTRTETNSRSQCSVRGCSVRFALVWYNVVSRTVPNRHLWFV